MKQLPAALLLFCAAAAAAPAVGQSSLTPAEARAIAKEAYVYGFPLVDNYRIQYAYFVDRADKEYKAPYNTLFNSARVYTAADRAIQAPNSDTPYSFAGADLRAEPLVISVPAMDKGRFYHIQLVDMYTHNFAYIGTRTTGNGAGSYLLAGPKWKGEKPAGVKRVIRSETELAFVLIRTQLFNPADIENVKKVQAGYKVEPLSSFLRQPAPPPAPPIDFVRPAGAKEERTSLQFFTTLGFALQFCPVHPSERKLRARLAKLGVGAGRPSDPAALSPEVRKAVEAGMADAWKVYQALEQKKAKGEIGLADLFGTRAFLKNNYPYRMLAAADGIYGNSKEEAVYLGWYHDAQGKPLQGSGRYTVRFAADALPPVNAFWSVTMYEAPSRLLVANPLNRYLINSPMLPQLKRDADGGLTLYIQRDSPGKERESNWLPAPAGSFLLAARLYNPKPAAMDGTWKLPPLERQQ